VRFSHAPRLVAVLTLVLTRHGLTTRSKPEQHLGQTIDVPLSDAGREQAERLAERLRMVAFERIFSSPLRRAQETADVVAAGRPVELDRRLLEMDYGEWEGLTYAEIDARDGKLRARPEGSYTVHPSCRKETVMRRATLTLVTAALLLTGLVLTSPVAALEVGQKAPDFTLPAPGGKQVKLSDLTAKGPVVIFTFIQAFTGT